MPVAALLALCAVALLATRRRSTTERAVRGRRARVAASLAVGLALVTVSCTQDGSSPTGAPSAIPTGAGTDVDRAQLDWGDRKSVV